MADLEEKIGKPISDVSPADKTPASATSKPIIITNHSVMKDPMVLPDKATTGDAAAADSTENIVAKLPTKITLQPIHANVVPDSPSAFDIAKKSTETEVEKPDPTMAENSLDHTNGQTKPNSETGSITDPAADEQEYHDGFNEQPITQESDTKLLELAADADIAKRASLDALIASKKYFLRIDSAEKRRTQRSLIIGIVLVSLLGLAWLNIALDAGIIELGNLKPITHFF
ncbi:hypothetical protein H7171_01040 [Candidatus Saccharibacteria bacterium]|nr:hypothetical protein [Candidatus Saccharibacteria bacterium]